MDEKLGLSILNTDAIERLLKNNEVIKIFKKHRIPKIRTVDEAIGAYTKAIKEGGYSFNGPAKANLLIGIFLGYPPHEVEAYVQCRTSEVGICRRRKIIMLGPNDGAFLMDGFAEFSEEVDRPLKQYLVQSAAKASQDYLKLTRDGISNLNIFNEPSRIEIGTHPGARGCGFLLGPNP